MELSYKEILNRNQIRVTIIVDAFRAFTTASYVLEQCPSTYLLATKCSVILRLASQLDHPIMIGKPEKGSDLIYDIPNSPTRVKEVEITGRHILHRTEAGAKGILYARDADLILAAGFVNADATAEYIRKLINPIVNIIPMGHEATTPSLEDNLCVQYIESLINDREFELNPFLTTLQEGSGCYFFSGDQWQYPREDFTLCLETGRFNFIIQALVKDDYAILTCCK